MEDIHDIRPPIPVGIDPVIFWIILGTVISLVLIGLVIVFIRRWKNKRQPRPVLLKGIAPYQAAMNALEMLRQGRAESPGIFYFELTMVLRQYLDASFGCHTKEMTSQQFVQALSGLELDKAVKPAIIRFVRSSDPIKYGNIAARKEQMQDDLQQVDSWVAQIEKKLERQRQASLEES